MVLFLVVNRHVGIAVLWHIGHRGSEMWAPVIKSYLNGEGVLKCLQLDE